MWSKERASIDGDASSSGAVSEGAVITLISPPRQHTHALIEHEPQQDSHERRAGVESRRHEVVVAFPPRFLSPENVAVEEHPNRQPHDVVHGRCRGHGEPANENDGRVHPSKPRYVGEHFGCDEGWHWRENPQQKEPVQLAVDALGAKCPCWTDKPPDHRRCEVDAVVGACPGASWWQKRWIANIGNDF